MTQLRFPHLSVAALTDVGRKRKNNEDALLALPEQGVFCVSDGMGGSDAGEVASSATVEHIAAAFTGPASREWRAASQKAGVVRTALEDAGRWIWRHAIEKGMRGCGTTSVVLVFDELKSNRALSLNAGDSRAYRMRDQRLKQITDDHSFAAATGVKDETLLPARFRSIITRAVGITETVVLDESRVEVLDGDVFMLCSDGLTRMVRDERICEILETCAVQGPAQVAKALIDEANGAGGNDNISVIVIYVHGIPVVDYDAEEMTSTRTFADVAGDPAATTALESSVADDAVSLSSGRTRESTALSAGALDWAAGPSTAESAIRLPVAKRSKQSRFVLALFVIVAIVAGALYAMELVLAALDRLAAKRKADVNTEMQVPESHGEALAPAVEPDSTQWEDGLTTPEPEDDGPEWDGAAAPEEVNPDAMDTLPGNDLQEAASDAVPADGDIDAGWGEAEL